MSQNGTQELVPVNIDGQEFNLPKGMNLVEAVNTVGKEIPHYCYHPKLSVAGNCRMCLIDMGMPMRDRATGDAILDENGVQKIGWMPKPAIACNSNVSPGLHIKLESETVKDYRNGIMEFLLVNHPLDCPICDQAGECRLQEFSADYGRGYSRFIEDKNVKPKRTKLGERVTLDDERCILCSRCVRFSSEIAGEDVLGFVDRGSYSTLTCYPGKSLDHNYSLNTVDICPVGALTSTDFRFKMRVWFLKEANSICSESSVGSNTVVSSREGKIYRITPRRNDAVNDTWMTDSARELYKQVEEDTRLLSPQILQKEASLDDALSQSVEILKNDKLRMVGSSLSSVEEQFILRKIAKIKEIECYFLAHLGAEDGLLLSADRRPNTRGALLNDLISDVPTSRLDRLEEEIKLGLVDTLLVIHEDLSLTGIDAELLKDLKIVYLGTHTNSTSALASVNLPTLTVFEKKGSFVNQSFRLQKFNQAVPGPAGLFPDTLILTKLLSGISGEEFISPTVDLIWEELAASTPELNDITFHSIGTDGIALNADRFRNLQFPEVKSLKFSIEDFRATEDLVPAL